MKKLLLTTFFVVTFFALSAVSASAVVNDTIKVGLRYGDTALFSANLENAVGAGYEFGYFDEQREFQYLGETDEITISMTAAGDIYMSESGSYSQDMPSGGHWFLGQWHVEIDGFRDFDDASRAARDLGGYPAWVDFEFVVRVGHYRSQSEAEDAARKLGEGYAAASSKTGVVVTVTGTDEFLFEFDASGVLNLGVQPISGRSASSTWFKGYKYPGAFEYPRTTGGNLSVLNVVDLEDYVKGVVPYEMNTDWPMAALEAQAICARTYACRDSKHLAAYGFDVCNSTDCQVYYGHGSGGASPSDATNQAVDNTAGLMLYYDGELVQNAVYHSSNGGATEDAANVWGTVTPYLLGKKDPYEALISIPDYNWTVSYSAEELTWILDQKGYQVGTVKNVYVSEYTPLGNVSKVTFEGSRDTVTVKGETCRTIFYSSTYGKSVKSMRFTINGDAPSSSGGIVVGNGQSLSSLEGASVITGSGSLERLPDNACSVITSSGTTTVTASGSSGTKTSSSKSSSGFCVITGSGSGHNIGMSQYGARAMAENGYDFEEILEFYYTGVTIR